MGWGGAQREKGLQTLTLQLCFLSAFSTDVRKAQGIPCEYHVRVLIFMSTYLFIYTYSLSIPLPGHPPLTTLLPSLLPFSWVGGCHLGISHPGTSTLQGWVHPLPLRPDKAAQLEHIPQT